MSRITKWVAILLAIVAVIGLVNQAQNIIARDPLARFAQNPMGDIGIRLTDVTLKHFLKGQLTGTAHIDTINVNQNHQNLDFVGVKDGRYESSQGPIKFSTQLASYSGVSDQIQVQTPSKVQAKDLDVVTPAFMFDANTSTITMPGDVTGTWMGGQIKATNLVYHGQTGKSHIKHVDWIGVPPKNNEVEVLQTGTNRTKWHISGEVEADNNFANYTDARADDGEILVTAPHAQLDRHTDVLTATGTVHYYSEKANLICDKAVIYRREKKAVLTGNVHMLVKPKDQEKLDVGDIPPWKPPVPAAVAEKRPAAPETPEDQQEKDLDDEVRSTKTQRKYPAHIRADEIVYWYGKGNRHATITGSPESYQELKEGRWRRVVCNHALYDGEKDTLTLLSSQGKSDTRMMDSLGDDIRGEYFVVSTKEGDDSFKGHGAEGIVTTDDDEIPSDKPASPTTAPPALPGKVTPTPKQPSNPAPATPAGH